MPGGPLSALAGRGRSPRCEEALGRHHPGLGERRDPLRDPGRDRLLRALAGREAARLDGQVAAKALVELLLDRVQEAGAEAVDADDQRQADHQRGRGRGGAGGVRARRVRGDPALDRRELSHRPREHPVSGSIRNGAISAIPKKIAIVPPIPAATTGVVVSSAAPSRKAPARPGTISATPRKARRRRRAVAQALGAQHGADRRDAPGPPRRVERAEQRRRDARSRPRR